MQSLQILRYTDRRLELAVEFPRDSTVLSVQWRVVGCYDTLNRFALEVGRWRGRACLKPHPIDSLILNRADLPRHSSTIRPHATEIPLLRLASLRGRPRGTRPRDDVLLELQIRHLGVGRCSRGRRRRDFARHVDERLEAGGEEAEGFGRGEFEERVARGDVKRGLL